MSEPESEHCDVGANVRSRQGLAQHVCPLEMAPFALEVGSLSGSARCGSFFCPSLMEFAAVRLHVMSSHRWRFRPPTVDVVIVEVRGSAPHRARPLRSGGPGSCPEASCSLDGPSVSDTQARRP